MSIPNIFNKIKSKIVIDKVTFLYLCIIVLVSLSSFGLGRLSVKSEDNPYKDDNLNKTVLRDSLSGSLIDSTNLLNDNQRNVDKSGDIEEEKKYVASKNGKLYYTVGCKAASRIKPENKIWFRSESEAKRAGLSASTSCK